MKFTLNADGSAELSYSQSTAEGVFKRTTKGKWKADGNKITITPTEADGKPITDPGQAKPVTLAWNADKTLLESEETDPNGEKVQFKKVA